MRTDKGFESFPRLPLALLPTPMHSMESLRAALGAGTPRLLIKRDDLTGLALGGNKARKLEYLLGDARKKGADTLITCGAAQSNHALQTAAAARKSGFAVRCVLYGSEANSGGATGGNQLLHSLLETPIAWVTMQSGEKRREQALRRGLREEAEKVVAEGKIPYLIPTGGSTDIGALGYVHALQELRSQLIEENAREVSTLFVASGSGGTQAGMMVGLRQAELKTRIIGVEVDPIPVDATGISPFQRAVWTLANATSELAGGPADFTLEEVELCGDYAGTAYGKTTPEGDEAIRLLARTEGIFLDPVYTAKAFAALLGWIREGKFSAEETVLFWHTGGTAGLFTRAVASSAVSAGIK